MFLGQTKESLKMASIKKNGARKYLEEGCTPFPAVTRFSGENAGLFFKFTAQIGFYNIEFSKVEVDMLIRKWKEMEEEHASAHRTVVIEK
jgi:hypothetical protein